MRLIVCYLLFCGSSEYLFYPFLTGLGLFGHEQAVEGQLFDRAAEAVKVGGGAALFLQRSLEICGDGEVLYGIEHLPGAILFSYVYAGVAGLFHFAGGYELFYFVFIDAAPGTLRFAAAEELDGALGVIGTLDTIYPAVAEGLINCLAPGEGGLLSALTVEYYPDGFFLAVIFIKPAAPVGGGLWVVYFCI